jgi:hypothetical protein
MKVATTEIAKAAPVTAGPVAVQELPAPARSLPLPKSGDCSGLVSSVSGICGNHLKAALAGLEPEVMTSVFGQFVKRLAQMYCVRPSGSAVEMNVTVEYAGSKPPSFANGASREQRGAR